jgi:hypothetical protein
MLFYADGAFVMTVPLGNEDAEETPSFEFPAQVNGLFEVGTRTKYLAVLLKDSSDIGLIELSQAGPRLAALCPLAFLDTEAFCLQKCLPSKEGLFILARKLRQAPDTYSLIHIESAGLLARLDEAMLQDRYAQGQVVTVYKFGSTGGAQEVLDAALVTLNGQVCLLTVGSGPMIGWWALSQDKPDSAISSIALKAIDRFLSKASPTSPKHAPRNIFLLKKLDEPDRRVNRIICLPSEGPLCLLEDTRNGRLLVIHSEAGLLLHIFKGYRHVTSSETSSGNFIVLSGNRDRLERILIPSGVIESLEAEFPKGAFGHFANPSTLFVYSESDSMLRVFKVNHECK